MISFGSFGISLEDFLNQLAPFPHHKPWEFELEKELQYLESNPEMDFQSLSDIENLTLEDLRSSTYLWIGYRTKSQDALTSLHQAYCKNDKTLSNRQVKRYEKVLKNVPEKFNELLDSISTNGGFKEYAERKSELYKSKREEWKNSEEYIRKSSEKF